MIERGMFPHLLPGSLIIPRRLLGIQMRTTFNPNPSCLTVGVNSGNKIMKKVLVKLRRVPETKYLERSPKPLLLFYIGKNRKML
jgi:hypothetical protein